MAGREGTVDAGEVFSDVLSVAPRNARRGCMGVFSRPFRRPVAVLCIISNVSKGSVIISRLISPDILHLVFRPDVRVVPLLRLS